MAICPSVVGHAFASGVSHKPLFSIFPLGFRSLTGLPVDFALTEAAYAIVRIFQRYPGIALPEGEPVEVVGVEKQTVTLVLQITDGCMVKLS